jgi:hypothetical protein
MEIKRIRDAVKKVLEEGGGCPLNSEVIGTIINRNPDDYGGIKIKISSSYNAVSRAVIDKRCTDLEKIDELIYIVREPDVVNSNFNITNNPDIKVSITKKLRDEIGTGGKCATFCNGIKNVHYLLDDWYNSDSCVYRILSESSLNNSNHNDMNNSSIRELKVILGTCEEVIELRKKYKGTNFDPCEFNRLKLEIISHISSKNPCENTTELDELYKKFKDECIEYLDDGRYAYYCCEGIIDGYPVLESGQQNNSKCNFVIHNEINSWDSDFIVLPYDIEDDSPVIFSPKFYQALYHELYHFLVINKYRGSKKINEGAPEVYSEICYKQFLYDFICHELKHDDLEIKEFFSEYMQFCYSGSYEPYYDYVKNKMCSCLKLDKHESIPYDNFCKFVLDLIRNSGNNRPNCTDPTPQWPDIFRDAINNMISKH